MPRPTRPMLGRDFDAVDLVIFEVGAEHFPESAVVEGSALVKV